LFSVVAVLIGLVIIAINGAGEMSTVTRLLGIVLGFPFWIVYDAVFGGSPRELDIPLNFIANWMAIGALIEIIRRIPRVGWLARYPAMAICMVVGMVMTVGLAIVFSGEQSSDGGELLLGALISFPMGWVFDVYASNSGTWVSGRYSMSSETAFLLGTVANWVVLGLIAERVRRSKRWFSKFKQTTSA
jgi:hypothetical protein